MEDTELVDSIELSERDVLSYLSVPRVLQIDNKILIQKFCNQYYQWKIQTNYESLPANRKDALDSLISKFIIKFFSISRADTSNLETLATDFVGKLKEFIPNLAIDANSFKNRLIDEFNNFHYEITKLQNEKTLEAVQSIKATFTFTEVYKRILIRDLNRSEEEYLFIQKMFETKTFNTEIFLENYFKYLKCFIENFTDATEKVIRDYIDRIMGDFNHKFENNLSKVKNQVSDYINKVLSEINPVRVSVLMSLLSDSQQNPWEIVYEFFINAEPVALRQVVQLSPSLVLITIGLLDCKKLMVISDREYTTNRLQALCADDCTVIASGSIADSIVVFQNTEQKAFLGCLTDEAIILKGEIPVYVDEIRCVNSAAYVKSNNEVIFLHGDGVVAQVILQKKPFTSLTQVIPTTYRHISISDCGRFITLLSDHEVYLFSFQMILMYMDHSFPCFVDTREKLLDIILLSNQYQLMLLG